MTPESITLAERYVLESSIASGGMATVWKARDDVLARPVAVKLLHPHLVADTAFVERFRREALSAARLAHPHIVSIYDTGSEAEGAGAADRHFIVMEFCGGGTLADVVATRGPLPPSEAAAIASTICDALAYAHRNGIIHRDIKPHNVLVSDHGTIKVGDFGIAKAAFAQNDITSTGAILGTVTYLSPEQVEGGEPGPASDIYSLGILLHELLCGRPPFEHETQLGTAMAHVRTPPAPLRHLNPGVPPALEQVVLTALAKDPAERFGSADEMRSALGGTGAPAAKTTSLQRPREVAQPQPQPTHRGELRPLVFFVAIVALLVTAALTLPSLIDDEDSADVPNISSLQRVDAQGIDDFDPPPGDGAEHSDEAPLAIDGEESTAWTTENYSTSLADQKPGVGLMIDLGETRPIERVDVISPDSEYSFELRTADEPGDEIGDFDVVDAITNAGSTTEISLEDAVEGRYWVVWITDLPGGGAGSVQIAEVKFFGSG